MHKLSSGDEEIETDAETDQTAVQETDLAAGQPPPQNWKVLGYSLLINGALPWVMYSLLKRYTHVSEMTALIATSIPSLLDALYGIVRRRRLDVLAGFTLFTIAISLALVMVGGSPKLYLVRESLVTGAFGVLALLSLFCPRPLTFYLIRYFGSGDDPARGAYFEDEWQQPEFRRDTRAVAAIFGVLTVAEAAIRVHLAFTLPISRFLAVSPFIFYGYGALIFLAVIAYKKLTPEP